MKQSIKTGLGFGVTSGIITTVGLMVGLYAGTLSRISIIGGILTIAIADAFSDSLGFYVSKECESKSNTCEVWEATLAAFFSKFFIAIIFLIPITLFPLYFAIKFNIVLGMLLLSSFSYYIAKTCKAKPWRIVCQYVLIAIIVIIITQTAGAWIRNFFI
ncbi:hypothetical protein ACFLYH_01295 [Candidatus Dependentiae bacterium]